MANFLCWNFGGRKNFFAASSVKKMSRFEGVSPEEIKRIAWKFTKTVILLELAGYELIITNSAYGLVGYIYQLISGASSKNRDLQIRLRLRVRVRVFQCVPGAHARLREAVASTRSVVKISSPSWCQLRDFQQISSPDYEFTTGAKAS